MRFEINGGETKRSPSWKSRAGLVAFFWYETPLQPASFFPPYRYFILLRQTARARSGNCFPRRFQRKQRKPINISAPFQTVWSGRTDVGNRWLMRGLLQQRTLGDIRIPVPCACMSRLALWIALHFPYFQFSVETPHHAGNGLQ